MALPAARGGPRRGAAADAAGDPTPVALIALRANTGWSLSFDVADPRVVEVRFRLEPETKWRSVPPNHGASLPAESIRPGRQRLEVDLVDAAGDLYGPYLLAFDAEAQALQWAKYEMAQFAYSWIERDNRAPEDGEDGYIRVPKTTAFVCIQLVYLDGETTEPRQIAHRS